VVDRAGKTLIAISFVLVGVFESAGCSRMESKDEAGTRSKKARIQAIILFLIVVISVVLAGWTLVAVSNSSQIPSSDFVTLPTVPISTKGDKVVFVSVSEVAQKGLAVGVSGYLMTASGRPVTGAKVYMTYYLQGSYRTQAATTNQNGYFEARFPMNWTGWLSVVLTYFGDDQHQGLAQAFSVSGEGA
jgi:hypothetical protein